ncbi:MAG: hypothetical protein A2776_00330 [Candidatus Levybacteria bacterium RIFCSPHIGHO2_01_FULL_40_10]|nr:MAG: hypothetical protein A2776_00330 [Candidatus Levybacteria bacterium RIFCSPHIGHO2_01_FULL_40_10]
MADEDKPTSTPAGQTPAGDSVGASPLGGAKQRYSVEKKEDGTVEIKVAVPALDAEKVKEEIIGELVKQVEAPGFRKGSVPRDLAEQQLNPQSVKEEVLKKLISNEYVAAVKALSVNPIVNPRIHIEQFTEGTPLEFTAETCEEPKIEIKNYKDEVKKITAASKIVVPGKEEKKVGLDKILETVLASTNITIPQILIDQETDRLLSQLLDELKRLGISLDQYLSSRSKNADQLRSEYNERAEKDLKLEFTLRKIADDEKIAVEQKDIEQALAAIKDEKERAQVSQNPYLVAAIIRQQKTLDFLAAL